VRVPLHPFALAVRDYSEVSRRYTNMSVSTDMFKVIFNWALQVRADACVLRRLRETCAG
jgi:hypothetical protein